MAMEDRSSDEEVPRRDMVMGSNVIGWMVHALNMPLCKDVERSATRFIMVHLSRTCSICCHHVVKIGMTNVYHIVLIL